MNQALKTCLVELTKFPQILARNVALTHALYYEYMHGYTDKNRDKLLSDAFNISRKAIAADERDADAHFAIGRILYLRQELEASKAEFETAIF